MITENRNSGTPNGRRRGKGVSGMNEKLNTEAMEYIVSRLAKNALETSKSDRTDIFEQGKRLAYYEMLDIIKTELEVRGFDVYEFGIDFDIEQIV